MDLPILAFCDGWLHLYRSIEEAAVDMEPIDVENGEWEAFDSAGHVLCLSVGKREIRGVKRLLGRMEETVEIAPALPRRLATNRLRELLLNYLAKASQVERLPAYLSKESASNLPLDELVANVISWSAQR